MKWCATSQCQGTILQQNSMNTIQEKKNFSFCCIKCMCVACSIQRNNTKKKTKIIIKNKKIVLRCCMTFHHWKNTVGRWLFVLFELYSSSFHDFCCWAKRRWEKKVHSYRIGDESRKRNIADAKISCHSNEIAMKYNNTKMS